MPGKAEVEWDEKISQCFLFMMEKESYLWRDLEGFDVDVDVQFFTL